MLWIVIALGLAAIIIYYVLVKPLRYWEAKGVIQSRITQLWIDNFNIIFQLSSQADIIKASYDEFKEGRYFGTYQFFKPILFLKDADLIKQIVVKDFDSFLDHNQFISEEAEPLWGKNLFALKGDRWKEMRATLSPSFTSSKMKGMFTLMVECSQQFVSHFQNGTTKTVAVEFKDAFTRFCNDMIASAAFGIKCNSLKERENEFYMMGKEATNFKGFWKNFKFFIMLMFPSLTKLLQAKMFSNKVSSFFRRLVKANIESRERLGIVRPDMIHLLMEARKGKLRHEEQPEKVIDTGFAVIEESEVGKEEERQIKMLTDDDLTAQALIFFFGGFESVSTLMCFTIYELGANVDVQQKLINEIDSVIKECNGALTYEALLKMKYMDMVISEVLRKWPTAIGTDRVCTKPYTIHPVNPGEKPIHLNKGDLVWLPIYGLHRDEQHFPNPDRFDPERFSDENKRNVPPYIYIPFGSGPRSCIGNRFALLETKTVIFHILSKFEITVVQKSVIPIKLAKNQFNLTAEKGFWFGLKPRAKV